MSVTLSGEELLTVMEAGLAGAGAYLQFAGFSLRVRDGPFMPGHGCRITDVLFEVSFQSCCYRARPYSLLLNQTTARNYNRLDA